MLHWLAGQKPHDSNNNNQDPDNTTAYVEPPETPAPVFAVRAFKHAIFGTPSTQHRQPRRHSNTENNATSTNNTRPRMVRPKSQNDAATLGRNYEEAVASEPLPSPTKGILLTPGTAGGKRKTVSFGLNVMDNEDKRPLKSGLPDDCPGKFPSPWTKSDVEHVGEAVDKPRGRSKLTEALEQVRDESTKRRVRLGSRDKVKEDAELTQDLEDPKSDAGKYWKKEYDIYRENTTREVKKLVTKQKSAKNYARMKEDENMDLREELHQERKKVDRLENRSLELERQLKEFQEKLRSSQERERDAKDELDRLKRGFRPIASTFRRTDLSSTNEQTEKPQPEQNDLRSTFSRPTLVPPPEPSNAPPVPAKDSIKDAPKLANDTGPSRPRPKPRDIHTKLDDTWAPSSSLSPSKATPAPPSPKNSRAVTSGTGATPLQSLSINSVAETRNVALSMGMQPPSPQRAKPVDSPMRQSPNLSKPLPSLEKPFVLEEASTQVPPSSPFDPSAGAQQTNISPTELRSARKAASNTKENVSPSRPKSRDGLGQKPSAIWTGIGGDIAEQNRAIQNNKEGKTYSMSALEKARAKQAAKGRNCS
ncbi:hypothetical protein AC578_10460 [Pseudocercospora eumusae]|uniref:Spindle pole body-associated protein cut12 domain-containing protein n=1 Tax=Pseudocercospora eumusae TaxID=321146 RepID=A0A139GUJ5_9PEZI|nr:hypothetical protein AC578_10460 [Pseudocercospora eumusae]